MTPPIPAFWHVEFVPPADVVRSLSLQHYCAKSRLWSPFILCTVVASQLHISSCPYPMIIPIFSQMHPSSSLLACTNSLCPWRGLIFLIIELCSDQTKSDKPTTVRFYLLSLLPQCKLRFHLWTCDGIMAEFCHKVQLSFAASTLARQDSTNE